MHRKDSSLELAESLANLRTQLCGFFEQCRSGALESATCTQDCSRRVVWLQALSSRWLPNKSSGHPCQAHYECRAKGSTPESPIQSVNSTDASIRQDQRSGVTPAGRSISHRYVMGRMLQEHPSGIEATHQFESSLTMRNGHLNDRQDLGEAMRHHYKHLLEDYHLRCLLVERFLVQFGLGHITPTNTTSIALALEELCHGPDDPPKYQTSLISLGPAPHERSRRQKRPEDLDETVISMEQVLGPLPSWHLNGGGSSVTVRESMNEDEKWRIDIAHLEDGIARFWQSLENRSRIQNRPILHQVKKKALCGLITHSGYTGNAGYAERAVQHGQQPLELGQCTRRDRRQALSILAEALQSRLEMKGVAQDIEDSISLRREALRLSSRRGTRLLSHHNLAVGLLTRFNWQGDFNSLEEAVVHFRVCIEPAYEWPSGMPLSSSYLGSALVARFKLCGNVEDIDDGITMLQNALSAPGLDQRSRWSTQNSLAYAPMTRFLIDGTTWDLGEAIILYRQSTLFQPLSDENRAQFSENLVRMLIMRYDRRGVFANLEEPIVFLRETLLFWPVGHPKRLTIINSLTNSLLIWRNHPWYLGLENVLRTVVSFRTPLLLEYREYPERSGITATWSRGSQAWSYSISTLLPTKAQREAQGCYDGYMALRSNEFPGHHALVGHLYSSASDRVHAHQHTDDPECAISPFQAASRVTLSRDYMRSRKPGFAWGCIACVSRRRSTSASKSQLLFRSSLKRATSNVSFLISAYRRYLELVDNSALVSFAKGLIPTTSALPISLASDVASSALEAGQLEIAVEVLEQGRTLLWSQMDRYRTCLISSRAQSCGEWHATIDRMHGLDGFRKFSLATSYENLRKIPVHGPVIIVNISQKHSDALIVQREKDPLVFPLPNARPQDIDRLVCIFSTALSPLTPSRSRRSKILSVLRILWDDVVGPVVGRLGEIGVAPGSRIWWCPTYKLSSLPLHAAGKFRGQIKSLVDLYISSYTPTLTALIKASNIAAPITAPQSIPRLLHIAQPGSPSQPTIDKVHEELRSIQEIVPSVDILSKEDFKPAAVLAALRNYRWVHFSCHGTQDLQEPFKSRFHLSDKALSLLDIIQAKLPNAEFAYSSACHSAGGDKSLPDGIFHLAAGLQFSGFKSVIGTLYAMADVDGPVVAKEVYKHLFRRLGHKESTVDFREVAEALNQATRDLRDTILPLERWINFVHIGV
ncbi:hypothetical protein FRC03_008873 [Tulasnella sp. 419]|nr:hypothetical protein FRC03_008873 [Tulasnella sp. 419]